MTQPSDFTGKFIEVDGTRLHYMQLGEGGRPLIAIHGASGNLRDWAMGPAQALARTNRVLMFDRPGLGLSERPIKDGSNIFVQARLMQAAAARLGIGRAIVAGHSFGGSVALAWALDMPDTVDGLMLLAAPSHKWEGGVGLLYGASGHPLTGPVVARALPRLATDKFVRNTISRVFAPQVPPEGYIDKIGVDLTLRPSRILNHGRDVTSLKPHIMSMMPRYGELQMPIELIHGDADQSVTAVIHSDLLARRLPHAVYQRLKGVGHMPHHVAPDAMLAALGRLNDRAG